MADAAAAATMRIFVYVLMSCHVVPFALSACEHGTYDHQGIKCCHCGPGQHVKEHCTADGTSGMCAYCQNGTYKTEPSKSACKPCTTCHHPDAHLEEDTPCKHYADRKCRCKDGYFCPSTKIACTVCLPCAECDHGVKVACTKHTDTVCNSETGGASKTGIIVGAVFGVFAIFGIAGIMFLKKYKSKRNKRNGENDEEQPMRRIPDDIDPERHVPDLAKVIGWRDMRIVAMSNGISKIEIENCEQVHHVDLNERTIALLNIYVEKLGRGWGEKLRTSLLRQQKKNKAEQVERILLQENNFRNSHTNT